MPGNTRADGVQMTINLRVVGRLVTAEIAPQKKSRHQQNDPADNHGQAKARVARSLLPVEILLRRG